MKRIVLLLPALALLVGPVSGTATAGSHFDSPQLVLDPQMDGSDLYAFVCPDNADMVCFVANYSPGFIGKTPPFATDARYEIAIDQRGTGAADLTYRWTFGKGDGQYQPYTLEEVRPSQPAKTLVKDGVAALAGGSRATATVALPGGGRTMAGRAADSFYSSGSVVGLALTGTTLIPAIDLIKFLNGNVNTMVLQVPKSRLALKGDPARNPVIGVSATASRKSLAGDGYSQMSRLGNPAVDVLTFFLQGERINTQSSAALAADPVFNRAVSHPKAPSLIGLHNWSVKKPPVPRTDLWQVYLTGISATNGPIKDDLNAFSLNADADQKQVVPADELRLNMGIAPAKRPNRFGYIEDDRAGYPNGRRLIDDTHTIEVRMLMGEPAGPGNPSLVVEHADRVTGPIVPVSSTFPYVAAPR